MLVGVLAVQGAFIEHEKMIKSLGADCIEIRKKEDLDGIDALILPGGESTVQGQLIEKLSMKELIKTKIEGGLPVLATCAGLILLAERIEGGEEAHLGTMPVEVRRNAYGRQLGSFYTEGIIKDLGSFPMVFIRAPYVKEAGEQAEVLAEVDGNIVAVKYKNQIGLAFHPELSNDSRIHRMLLDMVQQ